MSRIISGSARGRRIEAPAGSRTRPTTDRVREAVFSAIGAWAGTAGEEPSRALSGLAFLDLFAGSGAMAIEAASRGAHPVVAIDSAKPAVAVARRNAKTVGVEVDVRAQKVDTALVERSSAHDGGVTDDAFDIVWADPPYDLDPAAVDRVIRAVIDNGWLVRNGLLVIERSSRTPAPAVPEGFETWSRRYGETTIHYAQRLGED
ncbi:16S rRNA (guanine(966)-N(2))-methyltransferase RsmD [Naumannella halotolerans]|uniref:16S rRNA (Guanine966-N2)-methyltransferase n=1 Tax=Naumannella halotolerans TaxID=993414 RepID=A0A4R7J6E8_9ACTN|nr:16S rRNA (guanine(966)-N(2))-methyltransferase RsmD [Naumannella halotolerans]TDT32950.1 16S rRNA (guanine966-N2)-methyltransferase [Naumannella halotolerans]